MLDITARGGRARCPRARAPPGLGTAAPGTRSCWGGSRWSRAKPRVPKAHRTPLSPPDPTKKRFPHPFLAGKEGGRSIPCGGATKNPAHWGRRGEKNHSNRGKREFPGAWFRIFCLFLMAQMRAAPQNRANAACAGISLLGRAASAQHRCQGLQVPELQGVHTGRGSWSPGGGVQPICGANPTQIGTQVPPVCKGLKAAPGERASSQGMEQRVMVSSRPPWGQEEDGEQWYWGTQTRNPICSWGFPVPGSGLCYFEVVCRVSGCTRPGDMSHCTWGATR